jgi:hypothetical protein
MGLQQSAPIRDPPDLAMRPAPKYRNAVYLSLLLLQTLGGGAILWNALPTYRRILLAPGEEAYATLTSNLWIIATVLVAQGAYWYRLMRVPIPAYTPNVVISHLILFMARLCFVFAAALFSVVFFRHLPELKFTLGVGALASRGTLLFSVLFSLFCCALEWERLGMALRNENGT